VVRLRATFIAVSLLLLLALGLGIHQLNRLERATSVIADRLVPALVGAQELEGKLSRLLRYDDRLRSVRTEAEATRLATNLQALGRTMVKTMQRPALDAGAQLSQARIQRDIRTLNVSAADLTRARQRLIGTEDLLARQRIALQQWSADFQDLSGPRLIDSALALENRLNDPLTDSAVTGEGQRDGGNVAGTSRLIDQQIRLTELSLRVNAIVGYAEQLTRRVDQDTEGVDTSRLGFELVGIAQLLVGLPDDGFRQAAARLTTRLRAQVLGESGIVLTQQRRLLLRDDFDTQQQTQSAIISRVSRNIDAIVAQKRYDILLATQTFDRVLLQTIWLFVTIALCIVTVFGLTSWLVVERQFNRRMARLTASMLDVAAGRTEAQAGLSGDDEIAAMARSLETFKANARQLRRSNEELEQFAYAAAHDMRTPLRGIESLAEWTLEDYKDLPEGCTENLLAILQRAKRLGTLQSDLLDYSRAGHEETPLEAIDLRQLIEQQAELIDPTGRFTLTLSGDLQPVRTYAVPLRQVLLNLISNAIKHHDREEGSLRIGVQRLGKRLSIAVLDDGPGIGPQYQEQIFGLFKRLQSQDAVEGSGLGLSLVQKLIKRHGGSIAVVSDPDTARGTRFVFDWPFEKLDGQLAAAA